jgi:hypothetical protein
VAKIAEHFNFGSTDELSMEELVIKLQRMYYDIAQAVNSKPDLIQRQVNGVPTDGSTSDTFLAQGTININTTTNKVEMVTNHPNQTTVTWTQLS